MVQEGNLDCLRFDGVDVSPLEALISPHPLPFIHRQQGFFSEETGGVYLGEIIHHKIVPTP